MRVRIVTRRRSNFSGNVSFDSGSWKGRLRVIISYSTAALDQMSPTGSRLKGEEV
jgi:hypothetical protein